MSRTRLAVLSSDALPDSASLNRALKAAKLRLTVDADWDDRGRDGYLACTFDGEDAGFDLKRGTTGDGQLTLALRWGGDSREQAALLGVVFVLASSFGALVSDPETSTRYSADQLGKEVRELIESMQEIEG